MQILFYKKYLILPDVGKDGSPHNGTKTADYDCQTAHGALYFSKFHSSRCSYSMRCSSDSQSSGNRAFDPEHLADKLC